MKCFITWLFIILVGLQSLLNREMKCRMLCNIIDNCSSFSSNAVKRTDGWSKSWFGYLRTYFMQILMAWLKRFFHHQHLHLEIFEMVWVETHYSFLLICNAMHIALKNWTDDADLHSTENIFHKTVHYLISSEPKQVPRREQIIWIHLK